MYIQYLSQVGDCLSGLQQLHLTQHLTLQVQKGHLVKVVGIVNFKSNGALLSIV
jgi:hypothetical protein